MYVDLGAVLVLRGRVGGEGIARDLCDALEGLGGRVVVVVDGDDLVSPRLLQRENDVRAWGDGQHLSEAGNEIRGFLVRYGKLGTERTRVRTDVACTPGD